jgi:hypothetical protein
LQVTPTSWSIGNFELALVITLAVETVVAGLYLVTSKLPRLVLFWVPLASLLSLPLVWLIFPKLLLPAGLVMRLYDLFAVVFEAAFRYFINRRRGLSLAHATALSLTMNFASFLFGFLVIGRRRCQMITVDRTLWLNMVWVCFLIFALVGCSTVSISPTVATNQLIVTDSFEGVIFAGASAEQMGLEAMLGFPETIDGYWTPSRDDVLAFEQRLGPYLQQAAPQTYPGALKDLGEYRRQYVGILADGQPVIFATFFCNGYHTDWQNEIVFVLDGGSCYFEVKYDVQTGEFYYLSIHGES